MQEPGLLIAKPKPKCFSPPGHLRAPGRVKRLLPPQKVGLCRLQRTRLVIALVLLIVTTGTSPVVLAAGASIQVYDLSTGRQVKALSGHNRPTTAITVSADGALALTASLTPELRLWSIQAGREIRSIDQLQIPGYVGSGAALQFVNGTNQALIARMQAGLHLWSLLDGGLVREFKAPFRGACAALLTPDQKTVLAIAGSELQVASWGWPEGEPRGVFTEVWTPEPRYVSLARDGKPRSWWNAETGEPLPEARPLPTGDQPDTSGMDHAILSPDGRMLLTYGRPVVLANPDAQWLHLWDIEAGKLLWHHPGLELPMTYGFNPGATCEAIAFSPDCRRLALGGRGGRVEVREISGERLRQELRTPAGCADRVAFLPDGKQLLTWGDKTLRIWDLRSGQEVRAFPVPVVHCLTVTPDGRFLLVGGDGEFRGL